MKKQPTYGIIDIPKQTAICNMEKGGDKDGKAGYRFVGTGTYTAKRLIALVSSETVMTDLYGATWAHTKKGWVKAQDHITWYNTYKEASNALASLTNRKRKIILGLSIAVLIAAIAYLTIKHWHKPDIILPTAEPINETIIPDEIPMD